MGPAWDPVARTRHSVGHVATEQTSDLAGARQALGVELPPAALTALWDGWRSDERDEIVLTELHSLLRRGGGPRRRDAPKHHSDVHHDQPIRQVGTGLN